MVGEIKKSASDTKISTLIALSCNASLQFPAIRAAAHQIDPAVADAITQTTEGGQELMVRVGTVPVMIFARTHPLSDAEIIRATGPTSAWPQGRAAVGGHKAHVLVLASASDEIKISGLVARIVTVISAAIAQVANAQAVLWVESQNLLSASDFINLATEMQQGRVPDKAWFQILLAEVTGPENTCRLLEFTEADQISTRIDEARRSGMTSEDIGRSVGRFTAMTKGLAVFCGREVEFEPTVDAPTQLAVRVMRLGTEILGNAHMPADGSPYGLVKGDHMRISLAPSLFVAGREAVRLRAETLITLKAG